MTKKQRNAAGSDGSSPFFMLDVRRPVLLSELRGAPQWFPKFLSLKYFRPCELHPNAGKNNSQLKYFCIDCCDEGNPSVSEDSHCKFSQCSECRGDHERHNALQLRLCSEAPSIAVNIISQFANVRDIFVYTINNIQVVYLRARPQAKPQAGAHYNCESCDRFLPNKFRFCSLECKGKAFGNDPSLSFEPVQTLSKPSLIVSLPPRKKMREETPALLQQRCPKRGCASRLESAEEQRRDEQAAAAAAAEAAAAAARSEDGEDPEVDDPLEDKRAIIPGLIKKMNSSLARTAQEQEQTSRPRRKPRNPMRSPISLLC